MHHLQEPWIVLRDISGSIFCEADVKCLITNILAHVD